MATSRATRAALVAASVLGCATGSSNTMVGAAVMTGLAAGSSVANRAAGGCIAICTNGTVCNGKTGLCDRMPCRGECGSGERCAESFTGYKCVPGGQPGDVASQAKGSGASLPVAPPPSTDSSSGPPRVVPKAEEVGPKTGVER